ncbi:response regulator [Spirosoma endophyticum]|uniref:Response regulatory domain-containing protein n=1 Tax=Spirosoma endophyticum TaxID=662367 RepID=A0A1I2ECK0_9BACT|nr:hypothetical protein [Spirosoma endophyticum]SFE89980.1 hypothetical protein SAMN05216167_12193 [Spirosoma endophyticum]
MNDTKPWVDLLDEDEDDYLFWQYGFNSWGSHLDLRWFTSVHAFLSEAALGKTNPVALVLDGVVPRGEETKWLSTMLLHPSCQQACLTMLSAQIEELPHERYMRIGATDHLIKPVSSNDLNVLISTVVGHIEAHQQH